MAGGVLRRLELSYVGYPTRLLAALGVALERLGPGPSFELVLGDNGDVPDDSEEQARALNAALAAMLGRVSLLSLPAPFSELAVRSPVLRHLHLRFVVWEVQGLPLMFDAAPALESVRLEFIFPSEAAPALAALASDHNLPALRTVEMTVADEDGGCVRISPSPGGLRWWRSGCGGGSGSGRVADGGGASVERGWMDGNPRVAASAVGAHRPTPARPAGHAAAAEARANSRTATNYRQCR